MARIWSDEGKLATWLEVELAATAAWAELGVVPSDAAARIADASPPSPERVAELEATLHHDTAAFVDATPSCSRRSPSSRRRSTPSHSRSGTSRAPRSV